MTYETGRQGVGAAAIGLDRIIVDRRAAVEALGDHLKIRSELTLQDAGPPLRAREICRRLLDRNPSCWNCRRRR